MDRGRRGFLGMGNSRWFRLRAGWILAVILSIGLTQVWAEKISSPRTLAPESKYRRLYGQVSAGAQVQTSASYTIESVNDFGSANPFYTTSSRNALLSPLDASRQANNGLVSVQGTKVNLNWSQTGEPPDARGYNVYRSSNGVAGAYRLLTASAPCPEPPYVDQTEENGIFYYKINLVQKDSTENLWTDLLQAEVVHHTVTVSWELYE